MHVPLKKRIWSLQLLKHLSVLNCFLLKNMWVPFFCHSFIICRFWSVCGVWLADLLVHRFYDSCVCFAARTFFFFLHPRLSVAFRLLHVTLVGSTFSYSSWLIQLLPLLHPLPSLFPRVPVFSALLSVYLWFIECISINNNRRERWQKLHTDKPKNYVNLLYGGCHQRNTIR